MQNDLDTVANSPDDLGISIHAGFPNPAADQLSSKQVSALNLNQLLIKHPSSTYLFRISGEQWANRGIFNGDIALIDRALNPKISDLVIIWKQDDFCLEPFDQLPKDRRAWGVVTAIIHRYQ